MKRIFSFLMALSLVLTLFTGCGKDKSPTTEELMEKYAEETAEIWLYDSGEDSVYDLSIDGIQGDITTYNSIHPEMPINLKIYHENSYSYEQFQQKLQASLMTGDCPDLIVSRDPNLLSNVEKSIQSGALKSFDEIIAKWDKDSYYPEVLDGVRSDDGKVYILPISYDPDIIVTTSELLEQYGVTENDFDDLHEITQTAIKIGEQLTEQPEIIAEWTLFAPTRWIPSVYDINAGKTALLTDEVQAMISEWKKVYDLRLPHYPVDGVTGIARVAVGGQVLSMEPLSYTHTYLYEKPQTEQNRYLYMPMRDTDGYMTGTIGYYAVMPKLGEYEETITAFLNQILFGQKGYMGGWNLECWLSKQCQSKNGFGIASIDALSEVPMRLTIDNQAQQEFNMQISDMIWNLEDPETADDWEELERSINIYLSE